MRARIWKIVETVRQSYWSIPLCMAIGAIVMSVVMVALDRLEGVTNWLSQVPWLYANQPTGARAQLQTIAGSMITVAGVTFSITIAAVANASAQFGPRLMSNFMNDRGNQITFGTFVATFLYCLLVLRTVRGSNGAEEDFIFVPDLAVHGGLVMALASLGVLIYFIHHIPESIHISQMIAGVGRKLAARIDVLYPSQLGHPTPGDGHGPDGESVVAAAVEASLPLEDIIAVNADTGGYVQHQEREQLMGIAQKNDLVLWILKHPGDFAAPGTPLVMAKPAGMVSDRVRGEIRAAFIVGNRRTASQDALFLVNQLVEVAARALSPGVNDPFTATTCIDWLTAALGHLAGRAIPNPHRYDDEGNLRIVAPEVDFDDFAEAMFGQLRPVRTSRPQCRPARVAPDVWAAGPIANGSTARHRAAALRRPQGRLRRRSAASRGSRRHRSTVQRSRGAMGHLADGGRNSIARCTTVRSDRLDLIERFSRARGRFPAASGHRRSLFRSHEEPQYQPEDRQQQYDHDPKHFRSRGRPAADDVDDCPDIQHEDDQADDPADFNTHWCLLFCVPARAAADLTPGPVAKPLARCPSPNARTPQWFLRRSTFAACPR